MDDRIEDLMAKARGDKPIEADPTTGFHPDQLQSYPLMRVGPRLYVADIEGVAGNSYEEDAIIINSNDMDAYSTLDNPVPSDFEESEVWYSVMQSEESFQGRAKLSYADLDQFVEEGKYGEIEYIPGEREAVDRPKSVFSTSMDLNETAKVLKGGKVALRVLDERVLE